MPQVREIVRDAAASNYTLGAIVTGIVNSDAFRRQGPEEAHPKKESAPNKTAFNSGADETRANTR
jgi:hypothetical protein